MVDFFFSSRYCIISMLKYWHQLFQWRRIVWFFFIPLLTKSKWTSGLHSVLFVRQSGKSVLRSIFSFCIYFLYFGTLLCHNSLQIKFKCHCLIWVSSRILFSSGEPKRNLKRILSHVSKTNSYRFTGWIHIYGLHKRRRILVPDLWFIFNFWIKRYVNFVITKY